MIRFIATHYKILLFGLLTAFFTAPGQTFLISFFIPHLRDMIGADQSQISALYSTATLLSACALPLLGNLLDRVHLNKFVVCIALGLIAGCLILASAHSAVGVFIGFFLIRNMGQGSLHMVSSTTMARIFSKSRGKAIGLANLGYPVSEAFFPAVIMWIVSQSHWRMGWICLAAFVAVIYIPSAIVLLRTFDSSGKVFHDELIATESKISSNLHQVISIKPSQIARDYHFYLVLPATLIYACVLTALFFHQMTVVDERGWSVDLIPTAFIIYGLFRAPASFLAGPIIDKVGAKRIFPFTVIPMMLGLAAFLFGDHHLYLFVYMALLGFGVGFSMTVMSALWAELYGTEYLGSIKGLLSSFMVFSTACAPFIFGIILDKGVSFKSYGFGLLGVCTLISVAAWFGCQNSVLERKPVDA